jgi:hypothetical protein
MLITLTVSELDFFLDERDGRSRRALPAAAHTLFARPLPSSYLPPHLHHVITREIYKVPSPRHERMKQVSNHTSTGVLVVGHPQRDVA